MTIMKYYGSPDSCVEYIKAILPLLGQVTSFEIYMDEDQIPENYRNIPDTTIHEGKRSDDSHSYHLILHDDREQEVWLSSCNCGYNGSGPSATKEVLQVLGIKSDFAKINRDKIIKETDVIPHNDLNMVIFKPHNSMQFNLDRRQKVRMKFNTAWEKWKAKSALEVLGYVEPLAEVEPERPEDYYFRLPYATKYELAGYSTNNALILRAPFSEFSDVIIEQIVTDIANQYHADVQTKIYEK